MKLDRLLLWLSAKGHGSWSQFRAAVEEFCTDESNESPDDLDDDEQSSMASSDLPIYQQIRFALQRLGHVEFYAAGTENGWRVVPSTVAFPTDTGEIGLLCGARSPRLLGRLSQLKDVQVLSSEFEDMPQRIMLRSTSQETVVVRAREFGFQVQKNAVVTLLSVIPNVHDLKTWHQSFMPETPGWLVHRFSISRRKWLVVSSSSAANTRTGLFRFALRHQRFYYLRWHGCSYRVPVQVGKYALMQKRRGVLEYEPGRQTLSTSVVFRPPPLVERALVLCSGRLEKFNPATARIEYADVPQNVVNLAAQILRQRAR